MQQAGQYGIAEQVLGTEIALRRAEPLGIGHASFTIFGRLVVRLRKPGAQGRGSDVERIAGFLQEENATSVAA